MSNVVAIKPLPEPMEKPTITSAAVGKTEVETSPAATDKPASGFVARFAGLALSFLGTVLPPLVGIALMIGVWGMATMIHSRGHDASHLECGCATLKVWSCRFQTSRDGRRVTSLRRSISSRLRTTRGMRTPISPSKAVASFVPHCATALHMGGPRSEAMAP